MDQCCSRTPFLISVNELETQERASCPGYLPQTSVPELEQPLGIRTEQRLGRRLRPSIAEQNSVHGLVCE
jgi:hypothetical protein